MMNCDHFRQLFLKLVESVMNCFRFPQRGSRQMKTASGRGLGIALGIALIVSVILSAFSMSTMSQAIEPRMFPDVPEKSWYASDLNFITSDARRILEGSSDGNFYPKNTLSVEQFLKCVVVAANQRPSAVGGYWAQPFIDKALQLGIITSSQFKAYRTGITRGEMAVIIRSAFEIMTDEKDPIVDISTISKRMGDYALIPNNQQESVCFAYSLGILTGMPDGKFHPEGILSRAEAVAVIRRVIDPTARIKPATTGGQAGGEQTGGDTAEIWSDAEFQAFMSTDEWKQYLNPNTIAGMKDGVLQFQSLVYPDNFAVTGDLAKIDRVSYVLPEPLYTKYYQLTRAVSYFARRYNATATVGYNAQAGGFASYDFSSEGDWKSRTPNMFFEVSIRDVNIYSPHIIQHFPEAMKQHLSCEWVFGDFHSVSALNQYFISHDNEALEQDYQNSIEILSRISALIYDVDNSSVFVKKISEKYKGNVSGIRVFEVNGESYGEGITAYSYHPTVFGNMRFYTNGVTVR